MSPPPATTRPWLVGPAPDLLLGCGLGYALLVVALATLRPPMAALEGWLPFIVLISGIPHYGATLLRVYATSEARRRYFAVAFPIALAVWATFAASLGVPRIGVWFVTLYLTWSPWHYTAQNFGLVMMFLRRAGVAVDAPLRALVRASFVLSFLLVFTNIHGEALASAGDPLGVAAASEAVRFSPLGIPARVARPLLVALGLAWAGISALALGRLLARARASGLAPALALFASQAAWFVLPVVVGFFRPTLYGPGGSTALAFIWVAIAHSAQYLWISAHFARASGRVSSGPAATLRYLAVAVLAGASIWVFPAILCAPGALGILPFESGLGLLVASAVNLHHFILDGAIWKLRDGAVGGVLVGRSGASSSAPSGARPWFFRAAFVAAGLLAVSAWIVAAWEKEVGQRRATAAGDIDRVEAAARRLALVGRDGPRIHATLGRLLASRGDENAALASYRKSLSFGPTPAAWIGIGKVHEARRDLPAARDAYEAALALDPRHATALDRIADVWLGLGDPQRALDARYHAALHAPDRPALRKRYEELLARLQAPPEPAPVEEIVASDPQ